MTTYLGKSCSFCLPRVPFVNCRQFMYLVISLLVLRAGYGIWLYQFLIIAYLFTLVVCTTWRFMYCFALLLGLFCSVLLTLWSSRVGKRELLYVFLCVSRAFVCLFCKRELLSYFSSTWWQGVDGTCDYGSPWTFILIDFIWPEILNPSFI